MKERPKAGDRVEFMSYGIARIGKVFAVVAETGVHFMMEMPPEFMYKYKRVGLSDIIRILPKVDPDDTGVNLV